MSESSEATTVEPVEAATAEVVETTPKVESAESAEAQGESATPDVQETEQSDDEPKRSRAEDRIRSLARERYELQQQAEAQQRELEQLRQQMQAPQPAAFPKLSDYNYDEAAYSQAVEAYTQQQLSSYQERQQQEVRQQQEMRRQAERWQRTQATISEGQAKYPDFVAKVTDPTLPSLEQINPAASEAVFASDMAADVAYYLANNPETVYALGQMSPVQAIRKVVEIEGRMKRSAAAKKPPPPPPSTVGGAAEVRQDPQKMSTEEWMAWRRSQMK